MSRQISSSIGVSVGARRIEEFRPLAAAMFIFVIGSLDYPLTPALVGVISGRIGLSAQQAGFVATADMLGMFAASIGALFWIRRAEWRRIACALGAALSVSHLLSVFCTQTWALIVARFISGLLSGSLMALGGTIIGDSGNPERKTAIFNIVQQSVCAAMFIMIPIATEIIGVYGAFGSLSVLAALAALAGLLLPRVADFKNIKRRPITKSSVSTREIIKSIFAVFPVFLFFLAFGSSWTYVERLGVDSGISAHAVSRALAMSTFAGMLGAVSAFLVNVRFGYLKPLLITTLLLLMSIALLVFIPGNVLAFAAALAIFGFFMNFATSYQFGWAVRSDLTGRAAVIFLLMLKAGVVAGPLAGALTVAPHNFRGPYLVAAGFFALSFLGVLLDWPRIKEQA